MGNCFRRIRKEKGITVITLAVTIIVMLILAGVAINTGLGEDGIINRAENAVDKYKEASEKEKEQVNSLTSQLEDILGDIENPVEDIEESPIIKIAGWNNAGGIVTLEIKEGYKVEYQIEGEEWKSYTEGNQIQVGNGKKISARYYTEEGKKGKIASRIIRDEIAPKIQVSIEKQSSSTIQVRAVATDNEMGVDESLGYKYYIKKEGESEYEYKGQNETGEYEYTNLEAKTNYDILVTANDLGGNTGSGKVQGITEEGEAPTLVEGENIVITKTPDDNTLTNGNVTITINTIGIESKYYIEYSENGSTYERYSNGIEVENNKTIYVRINDGEKASNRIEVEINNIDKELPQVQVALGSKTSNSITVNIEVIDNKGEEENQEYVYKIKKTGEGSYTQTYRSTNKTYVFSNLEQNTSYDIEVEARDIVGNVGTGNLLNQMTEEVTSGLEEGAITFTNPSWSNGTASIQISTNTSYQIEYQLNGTTGSWIEIANGGTISSLSHNTTVYARLTDGINAGEYASTSIKDTVAPTVSISTSNLTQTSVTLTVTASDGQSGLADSERYTYYLGTTQKASNNTNSYTYTGLTANTSYTLKVIVKDKAGGETEKSANIVTLSYPTIQETVKEGDYINYLDGTNTIRKSMVLYGPENSNYINYGIQIITLETVEDITLGYSDETAVGTDNLEKAMNSYNNAIKTLNNATFKYLNKSYASSSRCVGSIPDNPNYDEADMFISEFKYMEEFNGLFKDEDNNCEADWKQIILLDINNRMDNQSYFLASRYVESRASEHWFSLYVAHSIGNQYNGFGSLCYFNSNIWTGTLANSEGYNVTEGLLPVFTIKPEIKIIGGTGEENNPYILGT